MIRFLRRLLALGFLLLLLGIGAAWLGWQYELRRDPMALLDRGPLAYRLAAEESSEATTQAGELRVFRHITLDAGLANPVRFTVSLPGNTHGPLPAVLILGGLEIGRESLGYLAHHGHNALVAYQYPGEGAAWYEGAWMRRIPAMRRAALEVPAQVDVILAWMSDQTWVEPERISVMGYSFGAAFLPACLRVAQAHGRSLGPTVVAYGGADLPSLLEVNVDLQPRWLRRAVARLLALALRPLEPARHGPHLRGTFLFINGRRDALIPPANALALQASVPGPHRVVWLEAGHMNPGDPLLLAQIIRLSRNWLLEQKALNP